MSLHYNEYFKREVARPICTCRKGGKADFRKALG